MAIAPWLINNPLYVPGRIALATCQYSVDTPCTNVRSLSRAITLRDVVSHLRVPLLGPARKHQGGPAT